MVALERSITLEAGTLLLRAPDEATLLAATSHLARRAIKAGRLVARPLDPASQSIGRDIARSLGLPTLPLDPDAAARGLVAAADRRRAILLLPLLEPSAWDVELARALSRELSAEGHSALVVVLDHREPTGFDPGARQLALNARLGAAELALYWEGLAFEGQARIAHDELAALETFWTRARRADTTPAPYSLSEGALRLLDRLALAQRAWPSAMALALGARADLDELVAQGLASIEEGWVALTHEGRAQASASRAGREDHLEVARLLARTEDDPLALARAAELFATASDADAAEATFSRCYELSDEPAVRADFVRAFRAAIEMLPPERRLACQLRAAEAALSRGDADGALGWARAAIDAAPKRYDVLLLLGRAALARGDLVTAKVAFDRAAGLANDDAERARVALDLAEAGYAAGDLNAAERHAGEALRLAGDAPTRLGARNVLGKLLLARGAWSEAEAYFASDEIDASSAGEKSARLRARLNRAIAILSSGRNDEAQWMLEAVLAEGESLGEKRAVAFALSNLAVLAILRHDYAEALHCSERSIEIRRKLGDKIGLARAIINLAELRLRLGLVAEAEQALGFARLAMGPGMPASRITEAALVAGHIHLARGRTVEAARELSRALSHVVSTTDGEKISECHRLGARIALEDGDIDKARTEVSST